MTRLSCVGTEETVWDCPYDSGQGKSHSEDVGLQCFETACKFLTLTTQFITT